MTTVSNSPFIVDVDADPTTGSGVTADLGTVAVLMGGSGGVWQKTGSGDTNWSVMGVIGTSTGPALSVGSANATGVTNAFSVADHVHQGVHSVNANGGSQRYGDLQLTSGLNTTVTDNGSGNFTVASSNIRETFFNITSVSGLVVNYSAGITIPYAGTILNFPAGSITVPASSSGYIYASYTGTVATGTIAGPLSTPFAYFTSTATTATVTDARSFVQESFQQGTPVTQTPNQTNYSGVSPYFTSSDHVHNIPTATPVSIGATNVESTGSAATFAQSDHQHQGVHSLSVGISGTNRYGDINLVAGNAISITDSGTGNFTFATAPSTTVTTTSATTLTLTSSSNLMQIFTGTVAGQTVALPSQTTLSVGTTFTIQNFSTACVEVLDNAGNSIDVVLAGDTLVATSSSTASAGGNWIVYQVFHDPTIIVNAEDFYFAVAGSGGNRYDFTLTSANGGTSALQQQDTTGSSYVRIGTGTTNNATGQEALAGYNGVALDTPGTKYLYMAARVRLPTLSTATVGYQAIVGFGSSSANLPVNGLFFTYTHSTNSGAWVGNSRATSTSTTVNGSTTVVAGTWYLLEIFLDVNKAYAEFYANGIRQGTATTNIPTAALLPMAYISKTTTSTTTSVFDIDSMVWRRR